MNRVRRVLHCVGYMKKAGAETFIMNMYRRIDSKVIQFDFLCCEQKAGEYDQEIKDRGGSISYVDFNTNSKCKILKYFTRIVRYKAAFDKYDNDTIVHIHGHHAFDILLIAIAANLSKKEVIIHSHNVSAESHLTLHKLSRILLIHLFRNRLACSQMAGEWMFGKSSFTIIQNGIEIDKYVFSKTNRERLRGKYKLDNKFIIGHIGRFEDQKNHEFLVQVFYEYHKVNNESVLLLIGDGGLMTAIKKKTHEYGMDDSVIFLGVRDDVSEFYSAMDTFIFPSKYEGLGIVAIEAESADLPCIFSSVLPSDIDITSKVFRCNLDSPISKWIETLESCRIRAINEKRMDNSNLIRKAGFDIQDCSRRLAQVYLNIKRRN